MSARSVPCFALPIKELSRFAHRAIVNAVLHQGLPDGHGPVLRRQRPELRRPLQHRRAVLPAAGPKLGYQQLQQVPEHIHPMLPDEASYESEQEAAYPPCE